MGRKALGKGLDALFSTSYEDSPDPSAEPGGRRIISVPIGDVIPNRDQPRETFSEEAMEELKRSIRENGIIEPPVVRPKGGVYELIAGERRYRAARDLGYGTIEVIVIPDVTDEQVMVLSLIENIQRENLNAIEEGRAYHHIMAATGATQEKLSEIVGKRRSTVANTLRLLNLAAPVQAMIVEGTLAAGSARALVTLTDDGLQYKLARKIAAEGMSARQAEALVKRTLEAGDAERRMPEPPLGPQFEDVRRQLRRALGTDVKIKGRQGGGGRIEIEYYSPDDLARIMESITGTPLE